MGYVLFILMHLIDIPKTIWFNFRIFDFVTAIKLPIIISHKVKIVGIYKGCIEIGENARTFGIKIGIEGVEGVSAYRNGLLMFNGSAKIVFEGNANLAKGITIRCINGLVQFGDHFYSNCNLTIICLKSVTFGDNVLLGWDINIRDCDGHSIIQDGIEMPNIKPVDIGNHVWIAAYVDILKGVKIKDDSVIGYRSCVLKPFEEGNVLIAGSPAKIIKQNITWKV